MWELTLVSDDTASEYGRLSTTWWELTSVSDEEASEYGRLSTTWWELTSVSDEKASEYGRLSTTWWELTSVSDEKATKHLSIAAKKIARIDFIPDVSELADHAVAEDDIGFGLEGVQVAHHP